MTQMSKANVYNNKIGNDYNKSLKFKSTIYEVVKKSN